MLENIRTVPSFLAGLAGLGWVVEHVDRKNPDRNLISGWAGLGPSGVGGWGQGWARAGLGWPGWAGCAGLGWGLGWAGLEGWGCAVY